MNNVPRVIATYLPQFHRVRENDKWWGEGFTDWTAVKKASPLYDGHIQPRVPLNDNYYNLLDKSTMQWQAKLAKDYLVDGFCFWHYWFENGRKILEKPAENLLKWKDIDMPFCFCWANETWARSWTNISRINYWSSKHEPEKKKDDNGILLRQNYGDQKLWEKHFYYLLPFFKDKRYITYKGMPVFIIFRPFLMHCSVQMIEFWNKLANKNGFSGVYFVGWGMPETEFPYNANIIDAFQCHCKKIIRTDLGTKSQIFRDYKKVYEVFLKTPMSKDRTELLCGFVGYDNTPRNGENGSIIYGGNPNLFRYYFEKFFERSVDNNNPFVFIHAWNEWAEGNYLEPDIINEYKYLDAIKYVKEKYKRYPLLTMREENVIEKEDNLINSSIIDFKHQVVKFKMHTSLLLEWFVLKEQKISLKKFFENHGFFSYAVYGWEELGHLFLKEMEYSNFIVSYVIDKRKKMIEMNGYKVYSPYTNILPPVDVVVVTNVENFPKIYNLLKDKVCGKIFSLSTVITECQE